MKKKVAFILIFVMLSSIAMFSACAGDNVSDVRVMVEAGKHFKVVGESLKLARYGEDVAFNIEIDDGCYYVSNNCGAEYSDGILTLRKATVPQTIILDVEITEYSVRLNAIEGMTIYSDGAAVAGGLTKQVSHSSSAIFDIEIDENHEYNSVTVIGDGNAAVSYSGNTLIASNILADTELNVQLRSSIVVGDEAEVRLLELEGYTIVGEAKKKVTVGEDVSFEVKPLEGYYYVYNNCGAEYADGKVTLRDVRADQEITLVFRRENTTTTYYEHGRVEKFSGSVGTQYTAIADSGYVFSGWELEGSERRQIYSYANKIVLADEEDIVPIFVLVAQTQLVVYHANGGKVHGSAEDSVTYDFASDIYLYPAAMGEWCFRTFYRSGYVPIEYNTKPDGTGKAYSLGSRIFDDSKIVNLYLMWEKETAASDFSYEYIKEGDSTSGIKLTKYNGLSANVVIPVEISGVPVRVIAQGCFTGSGISKVIITEKIKTVERRAFEECENLETVYLCDSVEKIYNDSFVDCKNFSQLRMIAVLPPVYSNHLIGTMVRRFERLYKTMGENKTKLIFYGGSSIFQGIDGATIAGMVGESYHVINGGQNAYISGPLMFDLFSSFMQARDVLVFVPEFSQHMYSNLLQLPSWIVFETFYDAFRLIDIRDYENIFGSFYDLQQSSKYYAFVGKIQQIKDGNGLTYEDYLDVVDKYFTRASNFEIVKATITQDVNPINYEVFKNSVENIINKFYIEKLEARGITTYFAACGMWEYSFPGEETQYSEYETWLKSNLKFKYISEWQDHLFSSDYISDSISHLTREGAVLHSRTLAKEILAQLRIDGYV